MRAEKYRFSLLSSPIISVGIYSMKQLYAWSGVQPKFQLNGEHPYAATSHNWEQKRCLWWNQHQQEELSRRITPTIGYKTCPISPGPKETRLFLDCFCLGVLYFWFCLFWGGGDCVFLVFVTFFFFTFLSILHWVQLFHLFLRHLEQGWVKIKRLWDIIFVKHVLSRLTTYFMRQTSRDLNKC